MQTFLFLADVKSLYVLNCDGTWDNLMFLKRMNTHRQDLPTYFVPYASKSLILVCSFLSFPHPTAVCPCFIVAVRPSSPPLQPEELTLLLIKLRRQQAELNSIREHTVAQLMQLNMDGDNPKVRPPEASLQACLVPCGVCAIFTHLHYSSRSRRLGSYIYSPQGSATVLSSTLL